MQNLTQTSVRTAWPLQDAKAQFSAVVDNAMRGVPQHVLRRGKPSVVVVSEQDFLALKNCAASISHAPKSFIEHLLAQPKMPDAEPCFETDALDVKPREVDWS
jgi:antitoxin Phd